MRIRRMLALGLIGVLLSLGVSARAELPEAFRESKYRRLVYTPNGAGPFQYYAQNDPIWEHAAYEGFGTKTPRRPFGDGGCNPTALAMVIATLLPPEDLPNILTFNNPKRVFKLCEHSVNEYFCRDKTPGHTQSVLETPEDFLMALPLVFGNYATGNTPTMQRYRVMAENNGGTSSTMLEPLATAYGLTFGTTRSLEEAMDAIDDGAMVIALCSGINQPFSGTNGHYVVVASYDADYIYVLDPYLRDVYAKDKKHVIEPVEAGIKKIRIENVPDLLIGYYNIFSLQRR